MHSIFTLLCSAALFCNTFTHAEDGFGLLGDSSQSWVSSIPISTEEKATPPLLMDSIETPEFFTHISEDLGQPSFTTSSDNAERKLPTDTTAELESMSPWDLESPNFNTSTQKAPSNSVNSPSSPSTSITQPVSTDSQTSIPQSDDSRGTVATEDNFNTTLGTTRNTLTSSPSESTSPVELAETSSKAAAVYSTANVSTTSVQYPSIVASSSLSYPEVTSGLPNSTYTSMPTASSSSVAHSTALEPELTTRLPNSTQDYTSTAVSLSMPLSSVRTVPSPEATSGLSNYTSSTTIFESKIPTETLSNNVSEYTSVDNLSTSMNIPSGSLTSLTRGLNTTSPTSAASNSLNPVYTGPSANNSVTVVPITSSNTNLAPSGTAVYPPYNPPSTPIPNSGNLNNSLPLGSSIVSAPYQSATRLPNSTHTASPLNSTSVGSSYPAETSTISSAPTIVMPTATNTGSTFIPSSIIAQSSSTYSTGHTTTLATGIPSSLPKIVQNPLSCSSPAEPEDTTEVQIGFQWALNYPFVVGHPLSTSQIFTYLPVGVADGIGLQPEQIVVKNLFPLDTTEQLQYITTVARIFIPSSMVDTLRIDLGIAASPIYQNEDDSVRTLMNYINPAIPYFPGTVMEHGSLSSTSVTQVTVTSTPDSGVFSTDTQQPQSASAKGTTAGIALAACGGAAAYGAAMFLLARRYKHRQQSLSRPESFGSSNASIESADSHIVYGDDGVVMSGGRTSLSQDRHSRGSGRTGHSARTAQISAPMMSENSLGWN